MGCIKNHIASKECYLPPTLFFDFFKEQVNRTKTQSTAWSSQTNCTHTFCFCTTIYGRWWCSCGTIHPSIVLHNHTHIHTHKISTSTCQSCKRGSAELYLGTNRAAQNQKPANVANDDTCTPAPKSVKSTEKLVTGRPTAPHHEHKQTAVLCTSKI